MSLASNLQRNGPVRDWFTGNFPNTAAVSRAGNQALRGGGREIACAVPPIEGSEPGLVGTAAGIALGAYLRADALRQTPAVLGARRLERGRQLYPRSPLAIERDVVARIGELDPVGHELGWLRVVGVSEALRFASSVRDCLPSRCAWRHAPRAADPASRRGP